MTDNTAEFEGTSPSAANINLDVPLPGALTGHRLIEISDIDATAWSDNAYSAGIDVATGLGIDVVEDGDGVKGTLPRPNFYVESWFDSASKVPNVDKTELEHVRDFIRMKIKEYAEDPSWEIETGLHDIDIRRIPIPRPVPEGSLSSYNSRWLDQFDSPMEGMAVHLSAKSWDLDVGIGLMSTSKITSRTAQRMHQIAAYFTSSLSFISKGIVVLPASGITGQLIVKPVQLRVDQTEIYTLKPQSPQSTKTGDPKSIEIDTPKFPSPQSTKTGDPKLLIKQTIGVSSFLEQYGLGPTLKTFTLLPSDHADHCS